MNEQAKQELGRLMFPGYEDHAPGETTPFDSSRESQDYYCRGCVHAEEGSCNVMLKDGEECGDRIESVEVTDDPIPGGYAPELDAWQEWSDS